MNRFIKGLTYTFNRNLGRLDRILRTSIAFVVISTWYFGLIPGIIGSVIGILALMILGTAVISRCGVTYWLDANTMSQEEKKEFDLKGISYE